MSDRLLEKIDKYLNKANESRRGHFPNVNVPTPDYVSDIVDKIASAREIKNTKYHDVNVPSDFIDKIAKKKLNRKELELFYDWYDLVIDGVKLQMYN